MMTVRGMRNLHGRWILLSILFIMMAYGVFYATDAGAFTVTTTDDTVYGLPCNGINSCSLRDAIDQVNGAGGGAIDFNLPAGGTIVIGTAYQITTAGPVQIIGLSDKSVVIQCNGAGCWGIDDYSQNLLIENLTVRNCQVGIAQHTAGSLLDIRNSTFESDWVGIAFSSGNGLITNSTFSNSNNIVSQDAVSLVSVVNSTLFCGSSSWGGCNRTLYALFANRYILTNTIISGGSPNCDYSVVDNGNNIESLNTCSFSDPTSMINTNPLLGALTWNGGPTMTMALLPGSPAIDAGDDAVCAAAPVNGLDQRGVARPQGTNCDIGAIENAEISYTINAFVSGTGGSISPSGGIGIPSGLSQTFSINADPTYEVLAVFVDGKNQGAITAYTFSNVSANHSIVAYFRKASFVINAGVSGTGGSISPLGATTVNRGNNQAYTITPDAGYAVKQVIVDGIDQGPIGSYTFNSVTAPHTILVYFRPIIFIIGCGNGTGGGTIYPLGNHSVPEGASKTFNFYPGAGAPSGIHLRHLNIDGVANVPAGNSYTFNNVTGNHTIAAYFGVYINTSLGNAGGTISLVGGTLSPSGQADIYYGTPQIRFNITPNAGYIVSRLVVDGVDVAAATTYDFFNVTAGHSIVAYFTTNTHTIHSGSDNSALNGGSISPAGHISVAHGTDQTFTITANPGYEVFFVYIDGQNRGSFNTYTFTNVTADHSIVPVFRQMVFNIYAGVSGTGGTISPPGNTPVDRGGSQAYTITPAQGYAVNVVYVDGKNQGPIESYTFDNVTLNHSIVVYFRHL